MYSVWGQEYGIYNTAPLAPILSPIDLKLKMAVALQYELKQVKKITDMKPCMRTANVCSPRIASVLCDSLHIVPLCVTYLVLVASHYYDSYICPAGDHIIVKYIPVDHHMLVSKVDVENHCITVIHYCSRKLSEVGGDKCVHQRKIAIGTVVMMDELQIATYSDLIKVFPPEKAIERALSRLNEKNNDAIGRNDETFVNWALTGKEIGVRSQEIRAAIEVGAIGGTGAVIGAVIGAVGGPPGALIGAAIGGVLGGAFGALSGVLGRSKKKQKC